MRPVALALEGFSAYRRPTRIDFSDADFVSLSGATGSGKSSLVDAMVFALYGRVPRLGGGAVAPVISAGSDRARVSLDFIAGDELYTVVRQVVRTKGGGATTNEARLERGTETLAATADGVTKAVEELLRLRYDDFIRTVVLPQGDFARFLSATKAERQGLLRKLLDLDVYAEVRRLARGREDTARDRVLQARARREGLEVPDDSAIAGARTRMVELEDLSETVVVLEEELNRLDRDAVAAATALGGLEDGLERLGEIKPPNDLEALSHLANQARDAHLGLEAQRDQLQVEADAALLMLTELPSAEAIESGIKGLDRLEVLELRLAGLDTSEIDEKVRVSGEAVDASSSRHQEAVAALAAARMTHAAHAIRATLVVGDPCPVCDIPVVTVGDAPKGSDFHRLEKTEKSSGESVEAARAQLGRLVSEQAALRATRQEVEAALAGSREEMAAVPPRDRLLALGHELEEAIRASSKKQGELDALDQELSASRRRLEQTAEALRSIGRDLMAARELVADMRPPLPHSDDDLVRWKELLDWVEETRSRLADELTMARKTAESKTAAAGSARERLSAIALRLGIDPSPPFAVRIARAHEQAKQEMKAMEALAREVADLDELILTSGTAAEVAGSLADHLKADGFERWLMAGALTDLVAGANDLLTQLTDGGYTLFADDEGAFTIVDHRNADETRSVATLSGGETFLVSLALALALAETLAAGSASSLDAIFLDEGFGTLDEESLDIVASVLEELTGRGLMVGIITHVKELATRATVRFEVRREPSGSVVERAPL